MKIFNIFLTAIAICIATSINAQEEVKQKKIRLGVKAGLNLSNITSGKGSYDNTKTKAGFHAGITLDYAFSSHWYLISGVEYTFKGIKVELNPDNQNITAAYVQLPLLAGFKFQLSNDMAILVNTGPYFAYGIHGKIKEGSYKQDTFSDIALKKFDCGINIGATLEWEKLCFSLGGELGFVNIMQKGNDKAETRNFTLSVGYKF